MDSFGRLIVIILTVLLLVIKPLQYSSTIQSKHINEEIQNLTQKLVHSICLENKLTIEEYEDYLSRLSQLGSAFDIKISTGSLIEFYDDNENTSSQQLMFLNNQIEVKHEHSDACYFGTQHICSEKGGSCYIWDLYYYQYTHVHNSSCPIISHSSYGINSSSSAYTWICGHGNGVGDPGASTVTNTIITYYCNYCGVQTGQEVERDCPVCPAGGWSGSSGSCSKTDLNCSKQYDYSGEYIKNCGKISGNFYYNDSDETNDPKCLYVVMDMQPLYEEQTIELGKDIDRRCITFFLDGHKEIIQCEDNYKAIYGMQEVSLVYTGLYNNAKTTGSIIKHIQVNTMIFYVCMECGLHYESDELGDDPGCPVCNTKLIGIHVNVLKNEYEIGEELQLEVVAIYKNHEERVINWTSNYNAYLPGMQIITVVYGSESEDIEVFVTNNNERICSDCGNSYETPFCPECSNEIIKIKAYPDKTKLNIGEGLDVYIAVFYKDGHCEYYDSEFEISGYNEFIIGIHNVIVRYKGFEDIFCAEVFENTELPYICENGHSYSPDNEGNDLGCPYCKIPDKNMNDFKYFEIRYNDELLEELYYNGILTFYPGEFVSIQINYPASGFEKLKNSLLFINRTEDKSYAYGGKVY